MPSVQIVDRFFPQARELRSHFEERFSDPHSANSGRFIWDYWHVLNQYTVLRTPAYHFFPPAIYRALHERLVLWGRQNLGCHDISPPWLSLYVDGCRQEFHADMPHGPWAFVYSLTPWKKRKFSGGETFLLQDEMLSLWENLDRFRGLEEGEIIRTIAPEFNRLTVFDPRIPHGVKRVEGAWDPRDGRLVVHGWFVQPRPFIEGPLRRPELQRLIDGLSEALGGVLADEAPLRGILSFRFQVTPAGKITSVRALSNTLRATAGGAAGLDRQVAGFVSKWLREVSLGRQKGSSWVTLPLVFEA